MSANVIGSNRFSSGHSFDLSGIDFSNRSSWMVGELKFKLSLQDLIDFSFTLFCIVAGIQLSDVLGFSVVLLDGTILF